MIFNSESIMILTQLLIIAHNNSVKKKSKTFYDFLENVSNFIHPFI